MSNIKALTDEALLLKTKKLVSLERKISVRLIKHLEEVDRRRLHIQRGFSSLNDYLIRGLGYSGGAAHRRIQAMEVCRDLPEVCGKIESGQTNLTQAMQLQGHFEREEKVLGQTIAPEIKRELFSQIEGLSTRETEKVLAARLPEEPRPDKMRAISGEHTQVSFTADQELLDMLERIKDLTAHQNPNPSLLELFKLMAKKTLEKIDPAEKAKRARPRKSPAPGNSRRRRPDAATEYAVYERDQGRCQFVDPVTGRKCHARRVIQNEHRIPYRAGRQNGALQPRAPLPLAQSCFGRLRSTGYR